MFELAVIGICFSVGYTLWSAFEWCYNEIKNYVGHSEWIEGNGRWVMCRLWRIEGKARWKVRVQGGKP